MTKDEKTEKIIRVSTRITAGINPPESFPRVNAYICEKCGKVTYSVDVAEGTTPMRIPCIASDSKVIQLVGGGKASACSGHMMSAWYSVFPEDVDLKEVAYEWRSPSLEVYKQMKKSNSPVADHVAKGGLVLHKRTNKNAPMMTHGGYYVRTDGSRLTEDEESSLLTGLEKLRGFIKMELGFVKQEVHAKNIVKLNHRKETREKKKTAKASRRRNR